MKGSIQKRSKASWQFRYYGPPDAKGKRRHLSETIQGTKVVGERVLRERLTAIENGGFISKDKETVGDFTQRWLDTYARTNTSLCTQQGYRGNINRYISPAIGSVRLQALTAGQVDAMYASLLDRGLSARTVVHVHRLLKEALGHAVKWGQLVRNVTDVATPPRPESKEMEMWDPETINTFLDVAKVSRYRDLYHRAVLTGLRRIELVGLAVGKPGPGGRQAKRSGDLAENYRQGADPRSA